MTLNSNTTTATTAAQWNWKHHALTVPLEAFVSLLLDNMPLLHLSSLWQKLPEHFCVDQHQLGYLAAKRNQCLGIANAVFRGCNRNHMHNQHTCVAHCIYFGQTVTSLKLDCIYGPIDKS